MTDPSAGATPHAQQGLATARPHQHSRLRAVLPIAAIVAFWLAFFWPVIGGTHTFEQGDFTLQFLAFRELAYRQVLQGRAPVFEECLYSGYPFQQDPQSQVLYPPVVALLVAGRALGWGEFPLRALEWEVMGHVLLAALGMFTFLRRYRIRAAAPMTGLGVAPAMLGAIAFAFGGYLTSYPMLQTAILETAAWLPLILLCVQRTATSRRWALPAFLSAVLGAVAFSAGHPQTLVMTVYAAGAAYVWWCVEWRVPWRTALGRGVLMLLLLAGLSAAQLLPSLSFMLASTRAGLSYEQAGGGFVLRDTAMFAVSGVLAEWATLYAGVATLALACVAVFYWRPPAAMGLWLALGVGALLLSFGANAFGYEAAYQGVPGYRQFQSQSRHALLVALAVSTLAAMGLQMLTGELGPRWPRRLKAIGAFLAVCAGLTAGAALLLRFVAVPADGAAGDGVAGDAVRVMERLLLLAAVLSALAVLFFARRTSLSAGVWSAAVLVTVAFDLGMANRAASIQPAAEPFAPNALVAPIPARPLERVNNHFGLPLNAACVYGLDEVGGGSPIVLKTYRTFLDRVPEDVYTRLLNVRHTVTWRGGMGEATPHHRVAQGRMYDTPVNTFALDWEPRASPAAWIPRIVTSVSDEDALYARMAAADFDPFAEAVVVGPPPIPEASRPSGSVGVEGAAPGYRKIAAAADVPALLVVSEAFHWNWIALVNGVETKPVLADGALLGVPLPAGNSTIELSYRPTDLWIGLALTVATLCVGLLFVLWQRR